MPHFIGRLLDHFKDRDCPKEHINLNILKTNSEVWLSISWLLHINGTLTEAIPVVGRSITQSNNKRNHYSEQAHILQAPTLLESPAQNECQCHDYSDG